MLVYYKFCVFKNPIGELIIGNIPEVVNQITEMLHLCYDAEPIVNSAVTTHSQSKQNES